MSATELPSGQFDIVLADPPWAYYGDPNKNQACGKHYACMHESELVAMPVKSLDPKLVLIWTTSSKIDQAIRVLESWGFRFRGIPFVWVKTNQSGGIIHAQGVRPSITKPTCEYMIAGAPKQKGRPLPLACESIPNVVLAPRGGHSQKPEVFQDLIERMYPKTSKIELFARRPRDGWTCWGNEL